MDVLYAASLCTGTVYLLLLCDTVKLGDLEWWPTGTQYHNSYLLMFLGH